MLWSGVFGVVLGFLGPAEVGLVGRVSRRALAGCRVRLMGETARTCLVGFVCALPRKYPGALWARLDGPKPDADVLAEIIASLSSAGEIVGFVERGRAWAEKIWEAAQGAARPLGIDDSAARAGLALVALRAAWQRPRPECAAAVLGSLGEPALEALSGRRRPEVIGRRILEACSASARAGAFALALAGPSAGSRAPAVKDLGSRALEDCESPKEALPVLAGLAWLRGRRAGGPGHKSMLLSARAEPRSARARGAMDALERLGAAAADQLRRAPRLRPPVAALLRVFGAGSLPLADWSPIGGAVGRAFAEMKKTVSPRPACP